LDINRLIGGIPKPSNSNSRILQEQKINKNQKMIRSQYYEHIPNKVEEKDLEN